MTDRIANVDEYIRSFPEDVQGSLEEIRRRILTVVPSAVESISYQIPAFSLSGKTFVQFAGWKNHISVYPIPALDDALGAELAPYRAGKATAKFPLADPIPFDLIERLVRLLVNQRTSGTPSF